MSKDSKENSAGQITAERILDAADVLFCERGFDGVSMRDIAQKAEVTKASVFYHYSNKVALFEKVLDRYYQAHQGILQSALEGDGSPIDRLHRVLDAYFDFMLENARYARLVQHQVAEEETRLAIRERLAPIVQWFARALPALIPGQGASAPRHLVLSFASMVVGYHTYAPLLTEIWKEEPLQVSALQERRAHLHWMLDAVIEKLVS